VSGSSLVFIVPRSASNGLVTVRNPAGTGSSSTIFTVTPMPAPLLVAAGGSHSCATFTDGTLRCWGLNTWGQLGDGSTATRISPVVVRRSASDGSAMTGVRSLAAGGSTSAPAFTCVALTDGTARCWGANGSGQLGIGATTPAQITTPVVVRTSAAVAGPLSGVRQVSAGLGHACAALTDGTAVCWGANASGQLGNSAVTTSTSTSPVQVIVSTGVPLRGIVAIVAGVVSTCASITDGTVRCWGANSFGQLGNGATSNKQTYVPQVVRAIGGVAGTALTGVATVAVGRNHACAALTVGTAVCWGSDTAGQLGDGRTTQAQTSPVSVSDGSSIMRAVATIATGENHSCAALTDGTVRCWGLDDAGQLGIGIINSVANPRPASVSDGTSFGGTRVAGATRIACGSSHTLVLVPGAIAGWGENGSAQLGDGTQTRRLVPWLVIGY
jgi:hypothetical protein